MSQNAIIYNTLEPQDADILLFARHSIRLLPVPSQYSARPHTRMKIEFWGFRCQKNENGRWEFCIRVIKLLPGSYRI